MRAVSVILYHMQKYRPEFFGDQISALGNVCAKISPYEVVAGLRRYAQLFEYMWQRRHVVAVEANDRFTITAAQMIEQATDHCIRIFNVP
ncbi:hypothetical protein WL95_30295 [Burkholderia cepacia]|nr:hypothetical protein WL95_30295 [Burkholderia cepacia]